RRSRSHSIADSTKVKVESVDSASVSRCLRSSGEWEGPYCPNRYSLHSTWKCSRRVSSRGRIIANLGGVRTELLGDKRQQVGRWQFVRSQGPTRIPQQSQ